MLGAIQKGFNNYTNTLKALSSKDVQNLPLADKMKAATEGLGSIFKGEEVTISSGATVTPEPVAVEEKTVTEQPKEVATPVKKEESFKLQDNLTGQNFNVQANGNGALAVIIEEPKETPEKKFNLVNLTNANEINSKSDQVFGSRPFRIATAGYSAPPEGYEGTTTKFLSSLMDELGNKNVGLVTSPTADKGSIDAISSTVAQDKKSPLLYITAQDYVPYINPDNFPEAIDKTAYNKSPKYVFPSGSEYSKATAEGSNCLLVTGGRDATVSDFVNAINKGNKVVILDNQTLGGVDWNEKKNRPNNGAAYIKEQIEAFKKGQPLPYPDCKGFSAEFLQKNASNLDKLIGIVKVANESEIPAGVKKAADHLKGMNDISFMELSL